MMNGNKTNVLGNFLRNYRKNERNISLRELSDLTGISFSHLGKIERGEYTPSRTTVTTLATALGLDKNKLLLMSGFAPESHEGSPEDWLLKPSEENESANKKLEIIDKITEEFPDADLMFNDLASFTAEDLEDVYDYIKFKKSKKDN
ncbi:helix-turn-helix domain-containing protein [Oceanobacillus saliphilus]|uniref:helix-turn-helix domain-containing protein n=1 Tax=Oceanobacillus saliphilus TaxID=2925834 RepID=UPI00201DB76D|nr:helix-turn-helix transcriptional regulator [Oceanobacillus saliphilus]